MRSPQPQRGAGPPSGAHGRWPGGAPAPPRSCGGRGRSCLTRGRGLGPTGGGQGVGAGVGKLRFLTRTRLLCQKERGVGLGLGKSDWCIRLEHVRVTVTVRGRGDRVMVTGRVRVLRVVLVFWMVRVPTWIGLVLNDMRLR